LTGNIFVDGEEEARGLFLMNQHAFSLEAVSAAASADTLRLLTCGSVDDGKSTLIGRLLYDSHLLMEDQIAELERDSRKHGTAGEDIDFALLVDGLEAEREQGITIDVAYRFFATPKRRFIVADTPGHVQYTRNMATGASTADLAILLVDATKGLLTQTRRHGVIVSLLGIRHVVLAVNKMDLVGFDQALSTPRRGFRAFARPRHQGLRDPRSRARPATMFAGPASAPWYPCRTSEHLEEVGWRAARAGRSGSRAMGLPPNQNFRGFAGTIVSAG
jgi:bifunctional enzyme CysN/CysC